MRCQATIIPGPGGRRRNPWVAPFLVIAICLFATAAAADIYRYVDDDGVIHYTDDIDRVPAKYKDSVDQQKSTRKEGAPESAPLKRDEPLVVGSGEQTANPEPPEEVDGGESEEAPPENETAPGGDEQVDSQPEAPDSQVQSEGDGETETPPTPPPQPPSTQGEAGTSGDATDIRRRLEEERQALLQQKEAFENNQTYQKRKIKRKYVNRPQIQDMMSAEDQIDARLAEIDKQLQETN
jgi:hypothetical protein